MVMFHDFPWLSEIAAGYKQSKSKGIFLMIPSLFHQMGVYKHRGAKLGSLSHMLNVQHPVHVRFTHKTTPVHVGKYNITKKSPSMTIV